MLPSRRRGSFRPESTAAYELRPDTVGAPGAPARSHNRAMKMLPGQSGSTPRPLPAHRRLIGLTAGLLLNSVFAWAQPDYPPAHWVPPVGCDKWYTTGYGHNFCVIHDMEGYYWTSISYLNQCSISASVHYLVNGLQNGSDSSGHRENRPNDPAAGDITQSVREQHYSWHARCWNRYMFGTEHEGFVSNPVWFSEEMYQASAALHRHLCDTYGIPKDRNHIIGHDEKRNASWVAWMATNWPTIDPTCNTHTDPGQYWDWNHFMALIHPPGAPVITNQPQNLTVNMGQHATFSVTAGGDPPLYYQWRFNGTNIAGATAATYWRLNAQATNAGSYSVLISNHLGTVTSLKALLTVNTPPFITNQPQDQVVSVGQNATFTVGVSGTPPFGYQWYFNGEPLADATNSSCVLTAAHSVIVGPYSVIVSNFLGLAASTNAALGVIQNAVWGDNSLGQGITSGQSTNLIAIAAGGWHNLGLGADGTVICLGLRLRRPVPGPRGPHERPGRCRRRLSQPGHLRQWLRRRLGCKRLRPGPCPRRPRPGHRHRRRNLAQRRLARRWHRRGLGR